MKDFCAILLAPLLLLGCVPSDPERPVASGSDGDGGGEEIRSVIEKDRPEPAEGNSLATYAHGTVYASYTWTNLLWLEPGTYYRFTTADLSPAATCIPVLHLFNDADPELFSKAGDRYVAGNPLLGTRVPKPGHYRLLISAQTSASKGTATVLMNGTVLCALCPVAGEYLSMGPSEPLDEQNYFTARRDVGAAFPHPDTRIFLIGDQASGSRVRMQNDDFFGGTFPWNRLSRIRTAVGARIGSMLVSTYSAGTSGYVDVYGQVPTFKLTSFFAANFPSLNATDAMDSWPGTPSENRPHYNCFSWAGGITSSWQVPFLPGNPWYVEGDPLASFDNYFANRCAAGGSCERYAGAQSYTRTGADDDNAVIALWARNAAPAAFNHASVRGSANGHPHGYAWESKLGPQGRIFHPRDALINEDEGAYGHIVHQYTYGSLAKIGGGGSSAQAAGWMDEETSWRRGLSLREPREALQPAHREKIKALKTGSKAFSESAFNGLYARWKEGLQSPQAMFQSDFSAHRGLPGYGDLLRYCRANKAAAFATLAEKLDAGEIHASTLLEELALPVHRDRLDQEVKAWRERSLDGKGRVTVFSQENTWIRFAKKVLEADL